MKEGILRIFVFVLLLASTGVAQTTTAQDPEAAKLKVERRAKLVSSISRDAAEFVLPENGAIVSARLGVTIWKEDPERAGSQFRNAVASLIAAQDSAEASKSSSRSYDLLNSQSVRPMIINYIAVADAEFALESLYKSRPIAVQKALAQRSSQTKLNPGQNFAYLAQQETNLEQRLIRMVAEQKPQRSAEMLKETIKKQISSETLAMLKTLWEKEPANANELANGVVDRLIAAPFWTSNNQANYELFNVSNAILGEFARDRSPEEKGLTFDESRMRSLARKVISSYIEHGTGMGYVPLQAIEPIANRFGLSASFAQLRTVAKSTRSFGHMGPSQDDPEYTKLMAGNPKADTLLAEAKKFPPETRRSIYITAANRMSDEGQYGRALAMLNEQLEDDALENAISSLNWYYAHLLVQRGQYDAAEALMMQFNENNRISALTSLATTIFNQDQKENRSRANAILQRVRSILPETPETNSEFSQLFQLINVMANVDPTEAFRNLEPLVDDMNRLTEAWAVVNAFQGGNVRSGEYSLAGGNNLGIYLDPGMVKNLADNDFSRTLALVDGFSRREMRVMILMSLLEMQTN
jgi:hypothetical protein